MLTCLAIDDDFSALEILTDYIAEQPKFKLLKTYTNPLIALEAIEKLKKPIDVLFLDIEMPEMNGLKLAGLIRHQTKNLVFTTAYAHYAADSYELEADDFLLKPISLSRFTRSINKFITNSELTVKQYNNEYIFLKHVGQRNQLIKIRTSDIICIEASERSTKIFTEQEFFLSNSSLSEILSLLTGEKGFAQIHRSFIIAENKIKILERAYVILSNNLKVPIGRKYSDYFHKRINKI